MFALSFFAVEGIGLGGNNLFAVYTYIFAIFAIIVIMTNILRKKKYSVFHHF
jgi:hypothetical protein